MNYMEVLEMIFTKYWPQVTLVLGAFAYFIQRLFDYKSKKVEINHSIFQQNRIDAVNRFFKTYNDAKRAWHELNYWDAIESRMPASELDSKIQSSVQAVRLSILELRFYFEPKIYDIFVQIEKGLDEIYNTMSVLRGDYSERENKIVRGNRFSFTKEKNFKANDKLITHLCDLLRKDFKTSL